MEYIVGKELLEKVLNYLATKPFTEVAGLINQIQQEVKPVEEKLEVQSKQPITG